jgi:biopolymer transport protein ExbB
MEYSLESIWANMGLMAKGVVAVLGLMAVATITVVVDRLILLYLSKKRSLRFAAELGARIEADDHLGAQALAAKDKKSPLARIVGDGIDCFLRGGDRRKAVSASDLARRAMARRAEQVSADLRRGMTVLASVGSVAPFVGLFGTVIGIINAFHGIAATGSGGLAAVSAGIAEALIVTAVGLGVAIPCVLLFNSISGRIDRFELALSSAGGEFADWLDATRDAQAATARHSTTDDADVESSGERDVAPVDTATAQGEWA